MNIVQHATKEIDYRQLETVNIIQVSMIPSKSKGKRQIKKTMAILEYPTTTTTPMMEMQLDTWRLIFLSQHWILDFIMLKLLWNQPLSTVT